MMKIKFLLATMLAIVICSCEKDNEQENEENLVITEFDETLKDYGLLDNGIEYEGFALGSDTSIIYFNGRKDDKLCVEIFNVTNKNNLFSWMCNEKLETVYYEDKGYGESTTHNISYFRLKSPYNYNNYNTFILIGMGEAIVSSDLYFMSSNNYTKVESVTFPSEEYFYEKIMPWYEDKIMVSKVPVNWNYGLPDSCFCYSIEGKEIFKFEQKTNFFPEEGYIAVSLTNYIEFVGGIQGSFVCNNIKEGTQLWKSETPFSDLSNDTRIDKISTSIGDAGYVIFNFEYTLYSGTKGSRKIKVNIENGQYEKI